jgi:hypothetical protein
MSAWIPSHRILGDQVEVHGNVKDGPEHRLASGDDGAISPDNTPLAAGCFEGTLGILNLKR